MRRGYFNLQTMKKVSILFFNLRAHFEGVKLTAYQDIAGIWTIGFGTTIYPDGTRVKQGDTCTIEQAYEYAQAATEHLQATISASLPDIAQCRFDAICDFAYNAGIGSWNTSTLRKLILANPDDPDIEQAFEAWDKAHVDGELVEVDGLLRRRKCEYFLYANGVNQETFFE